MQNKEITKYKSKLNSEVVDAFQLNARGLVGEDWFWDAVTKIIMYGGGKWGD